MNITRYEPFADVLRPVDALFEDFLRGFVVRPVSAAGTQPAAAAPLRLDVSEQDGAYRVQADLPGVKKEDIKVSVEGDVLSIAAEARSEADRKEGDRVVWRERSIGRWSRSVRLGADIDLDRAEARYENGVLELKLPRRAAESRKQLTVQ